jgi:hypothetical protein
MFHDQITFIARKFSYKNFLGNHDFSQLNNLMRKGKDPDQDQHPDADPAGPKHTDPTDPDPDADPEH